MRGKRCQRILAGTGISVLAVAGAAGCSRASAPGSVAAGASHATASAGATPSSATAPSAAGGSSAGASSTGATSSPTPAPSTVAASSSAASPSPTGCSPSSGGSGARNLVVSPAVRAQLTAAFAALKRIPAADVAGTAPHSVYYACDLSTGAYWALASFEPSSAASQRVQVSFQDGGQMGLFTKAGSGPWRVQLGGVPSPCYVVPYFPRAVLAVWGQPTSTSGTHC